MNARIRISLSSASVWMSASSWSRSRWITSPGSLTRRRPIARRPLIMVASPENCPAWWLTISVSAVPVGRSACTSPLRTTKNGTGLSPTSTSTSPREVDRRRPWAAIRDSC